MADNIDRSNGRENIAFLGSRNDIWHKLGHEMPEGATCREWAKAAGLDWEAIMVPAYMQIMGLDGTTDMRLVNKVKHCVRNDTQMHLGVASNIYKPVQPSALLAWFENYVSVDSRFKIDVAGSLKGGKIIWATAVFTDPLTVAGEKHIARLLMTTTYDGSGATINKATVVRVVCNNTLDAALAGKGGQVKTRHNTTFDAEKVSKELGVIVQGIEQFKAMGDAMVERTMKTDQIKAFFAKLLDAEETAAKEISTRRTNQLAEMLGAYETTLAEGTAPQTAWAALNAVTRYVDHDRGTRNTGSGEFESRVLSSQFGSGSALKTKAVNMLYAMDDGELLKSVASRYEDSKLLSAVASRPLFQD